MPALRHAKDPAKRFLEVEYFEEAGRFDVSRERDWVKCVRGRRAFRRPAKVSREGCWRYRKCEC